MEYRNDLADVLLRGLPADERKKILESISQVDADKLRRKRESGAEDGAIDITDVEPEDFEDDDPPMKPRVPPQG